MKDVITLRSGSSNRSTVEHAAMPAAAAATDADVVTLMTTLRCDAL